MNWYIIVAFIIVMGQIIASFAFLISFLYLIVQIFKKKDKRDKKKEKIASIIFLVSLLIALASIALQGIETEALMSDSDKETSTTIDLRALKNQHRN